jgi:NAD(P)-dependent dehydrogenase (short-subunit alcohol dehydrogenase family)
MLGGGCANHVCRAAMAGVISLARSDAMELGEQGIRVNCICPGSIAPASSCATSRSATPWVLAALGGWKGCIKS